jgi:hypothetical protein
MPGDKQDATKTAGFFSIDRGTFRCASVGGLNSAIAYIVMARGSGRDNRTAQWSINAIEQRTGISRPNAVKAVKDLLDRGIWKRTRDGKHPIYEAVPGNEIPGGLFTAAENAVIAAIRNGNPVPYYGKTAADALKARGIIREQQRSKGKRTVDEADIAALTEPLAIWLPNALVDGAAGEVPPIELIRQTRSLPALQLLIELYAAQFLPSYGGVPPNLLKMVFDRAKVGERGPFVVWGFRSKHLLANHTLYRPFLSGKTKDDGSGRDVGLDNEFWPAVHVLEDVGLVETVGMLLDGDDAEAEIIHPFAIHGGEPAERELARAASEAAAAMLTEGQRNCSAQQGFHLVPVRRHIANATVIEVFRLKYRPHTRATGAWYALMRQSTAEYLAHYQALGRDRTATNSAA